MNNFAIVGFIYNQPCPLKCDFCCHTKEVVGPGRLRPSNVIPIVLSFSRCPSVIRFAFTGGDPFLYIEEIIEIMEQARRADVKQPFHIVTSGYWATSEEATSSVLGRLHEIGMDMLNVSYDKEHARFVPPEKILNISRACKSLGITLKLFGTFWNEGERVEDLLPALDGVETQSRLVMPVGAARSHFIGRRYKQPDHVKYSCGAPRMYDLAIYPDGSAYPCCSGGFNREAKLQCGNVFTDSASLVLDNAFGDFHVRIAKEIGFDKLYALVEQHRPDIFATLTPFNKVDSVCEICRDLHANAELMGTLQEIYDELEIDYVTQKLVHDWEKILPKRRASLHLPVLG